MAKPKMADLSGPIDIEAWAEGSRYEFHVRDIAQPRLTLRVYKSNSRSSHLLGCRKVWVYRAQAFEREYPNWPMSKHTYYLPIGGYESMSYDLACARVLEIQAALRPGGPPIVHHKPRIELATGVVHWLNGPDVESKESKAGASVAGYNKPKTIADIARDHVSQFPKMSAMVGELRADLSERDRRIAALEAELDRRIAALEAELAAARKGTYAERKAWSDKYSNAARTAIMRGLCRAGYPRVAPEDVDRNEGVDFILFGQRFSWRNSKEGARRKYGTDGFTIRTTGAVSELDKILAGKVDMGVYSHALTDSGAALYSWVMVDWGVFRAKHKDVTSAKKAGFVVYKFSQFPADFVVARYTSGKTVNGVASIETP